MARVYFHCCCAHDIVLDRRGSNLHHLSDMRRRAIEVVHSFIAASGSEDWRAWTVHVSDDEGEEIFLLPFADALGRLH